MNYAQMFSALCASVLLSATAQAALLYDQNVTPDVIFGSGNANGSFTVDRTVNTAGATTLELGLRAKLRHNASGLPENTFNSNGDGTYSFLPGVAPTQTAPTAVWSVEWSIFSLTGLNGYEFMLYVDADASAAVSFGAGQNLLFALADHSFGTSSTGNGQGEEATDQGSYDDLLDTSEVVQNSWKAHWLFPLNGFDPTAIGQYSFALAAFDENDNEVGRTQITVLVDQADTNPVPEPGSLALVGVGLVAACIARKRMS